MSECIDTGDLVAMDVFCGTEPVNIDLVYADAGHPENIFKLALYHSKARLILHKDMARIVLKAARKLRERYGYTLILKDGLRTVEAQEKLLASDLVKANPHWLEGECPLLSRPGMRAHPRGMAIDVSVTNANETAVDMGTVFDEMSEASARDYTGFAPDILQNRKNLEAAFVESGAECNLPLIPLPSEWWDFRIGYAHYGDVTPIYDLDLPDPLKMGEAPVPDAAFEDRMAQLAKSILLSL